LRLRETIARLRRARGMTISPTTHYMREAEQLCDEIAFIKAGRLLARGTADDLKRQIRIGDVIALRLDPPEAPWLVDMAGVLRCVTTRGRIECTVADAEKRLPEILRALHPERAAVRDVDVRVPELGGVLVGLAR